MEDEESLRVDKFKAIKQVTKKDKKGSKKKGGY